MSRARVTIMRAIRLQLKSGYMKKEPSEFSFMKRYPPMQRETKPNFHKLETKNIPYLDLLEKVSDRNPNYDERVYPAYWQQEPVGLTLAKKQYQFMQAGDDEETAFQKAEAYVSEMENKSYLEIVDLRNALREAGAQAPFMKDESVAAEIIAWQEKLQRASYDDLELADQGEIDYLIQTKVMKWNEVERERRMKDPVFVKQFNKVRKLIFAKEVLTPQARRIRNIKAVNQAELDHLHVNYSMVRAAAPFYLEDYVRFFNLFKSEPNVKLWRLEDRSAVSSWIINCVATREVIENLDNQDIQRYLDMLKFQYFPMSNNPDRAHTFEAPTVDSLRRLLYEHDIGYKTERNKVFVRRYYRIPSLLFPAEALAASFLEDTDELERIVEEDDETALLDEIERAGMDASALPALKAQLQEYLTKYRLEMPNYGDSDAEDGKSALDALIDDATQDQAAREVKAWDWEASSGDDSDVEKSAKSSASAREAAAAERSDDEEVMESGDASDALDVGPSEVLPRLQTKAVSLAVEAYLAQLPVAERSALTEDDHEFMRDCAAMQLFADSDLIDEEEDEVDFVKHFMDVLVQRRVAALKAFHKSEPTPEQVQTAHDSALRQLLALKARGELDVTDEGWAFLHAGEDSAASNDSEDFPVPFLDDPKNASLVQKYRRPAVTALDKARDAHYGTDLLFEQAVDEASLRISRTTRITTEFDERAELEAAYLEKEEARRARLWTQRKLWDMPRPSIPVVGVADV